MENATHSTATSRRTEPSAVYALPGFPTVFTDPAGPQISIRGMLPADRTAVQAFFRRIPADERIYLGEDVTSPDLIRRSPDTLDYRRALPLLATIGDTVVGTATLHHDAAPGQDHIRIVVDPAHRNKGLGRFLLKKLVDIAKNDDGELERIFLEVVSDTEHAALHAASAVGFRPVNTLSAFVKYFDGRPHDVILMELPVHDVALADEPAEHMF